MISQQTGRNSRFKVPSALNAPFKADCKAFGVVIYGDNTLYSNDANLNMSIHIGVQKDVIASFLLGKIRDELGSDATNIIVGHEHGDEKKKCHFQCCVKLVKRLNRMVKPFNVDISGIHVIGMFQKAKNPDALWNYCKKDGDFFVLEPEDVHCNVWERIVSNKERSKKDITKLLAMSDPKSLLMWGDKIQNNYDCLLKEESMPDFSWIFPQHLLDYCDDVSLSTPEDIEEKKKIAAIYAWFKEQCMPDNLMRRQCLFMVSTERGLGKSEFAKRLVPHEGYYIYCRNSLDAAEFKRKESTARLVILDDVSYIGNEREMWKALVSGEVVNINTKYHNFKWKGGLPCIVLTNELSTVSYWSSSDLFRTQCCFVNVRRYLGPPGTRPDFLNTVNMNFDFDFKAKLEEWEQEKANKKSLNALK